MLVPRPASCERLPGSFAAFENTPVHGGDGRASGLLTGYLSEYAPLGDPGESRIMLAHAPQGGGRIEAFRLAISEHGILIEATAEEGLLLAVQRIRQLLLDSPKLPCLVIEDVPRFAWRGAHLDVARHLPPITWVARFVDLLALHGYNSLQLHLTDDQGWRMPVERYPLLTEVGGWRARTQLRRDPGVYDEVRHGGSYTRPELLALVDYAHLRGIAIVPEISMPGHSTAAIAAYPDLGNTGHPISVSDHWGVHDDILNVDDATLRFMEHVLEEVLDIFPSPYIHVGGDEVPPAQWQASPSALARVASEGLRGPDALYGWFLRRMQNWLHPRGRTMVAWDEALDADLSPLTMITAWRTPESGSAAASAGHPVIQCPRQFTYFDYYQSKDRAHEPRAIGGHLPLERVYSYEPVPADLHPAAQRYIWGTQFQLWSEFLRTTDALEYMAFPRACALAEAAWSPIGRRDYPQFRARLPVHLGRLERLKVNFRPLSD